MKVISVTLILMLGLYPIAFADDPVTTNTAGLPVPLPETGTTSTDTSIQTTSTTSVGVPQEFQGPASDNVVLSGATPNEGATNEAGIPGGIVEVIGSEFLGQAQQINPEDQVRSALISYAWAMYQQRVQNATTPTPPPAGIQINDNRLIQGLNAEIAYRQQQLNANPAPIGVAKLEHELAKIKAEGVRNIIQNWDNAANRQTAINNYNAAMIAKMLELKNIWRQIMDFANANPNMSNSDLANAVNTQFGTSLVGESTLRDFLKQAAKISAMSYDEAVWLNNQGAIVGFGIPQNLIQQWQQWMQSWLASNNRTYR